MGIIYKITNKINNKIYIGKTSRDLNTRWKEHLREAKNINNIKLYNAIRKYGEENFICEIVEDNIPSNILNNKESYYITLYNSKNNGYNETNGGDGGRTFSKLTEEDVQNIIKILLDKNNYISLSQIAKQFNISKSVVININLGTTWKQDNIKYPIRNFNATGITISREKYKNIINDILNNNLLLKDIQHKYNLSTGQITAINQGKYCYSKNNKFYEGIYNGDFPIRKDNRQFTNKDEFINIFYDVLFTSDSMAKIGAKYNIKGSTLQYIISGKRRKELTKNFITPMRKNIQENQKIFLQLYPEFKGGD